MWMWRVHRTCPENALVRVERVVPLPVHNFILVHVRCRLDSAIRPATWDLGNFSKNLFSQFSFSRFLAESVVRVG